MSEHTNHLGISTVCLPRHVRGLGIMNVMSLLLPFNSYIHFMNKTQNLAEVFKRKLGSDCTDTASNNA